MTLEIRLKPKEEELLSRNKDICDTFLTMREQNKKFKDKRLYETIAKHYNLTWNQIRNICIASGVARKKRKTNGNKTTPIATQ